MLEKFECDNEEKRQEISKMRSNIETKKVDHENKINDIKC